MPRDVEAGPASRRPSPRRRRLQGQVALVLASACVFSVAVIGHTHPPFPAPKVRRRDEDGALGAPTLTPSPQDPFSVYWAEMLRRRPTRADRPTRLPAPPNEILAGRPVPVVGGGHSIHRRGRRGAPESRGGVHALDRCFCPRRRRARGAEFCPTIGGPPPLASEIGCCFETLLCNRI